MNVSQLKYWLEKTPTDADSSSQNGAYLSYNVFRILSILGGFFGLDHLYLRSLWTFLAKFIVNILCFGVWWIYDMLHALFNEPVVKMYGLGVPGLGPMGIAAGVLAGLNWMLLSSLKTSVDWCSVLNPVGLRTVRCLPGEN